MAKIRLFYSAFEAAAHKLCGLACTVGCCCCWAAHSYSHKYTHSHTHSTDNIFSTASLSWLCLLFLSVTARCSRPLIHCFTVALTINNCRRARRREFKTQCEQYNSNNTRLSKKNNKNNQLITSTITYTLKWKINYSCNRYHANISITSSQQHWHWVLCFATQHVFPNTIICCSPQTAVHRLRFILVL